MSFEIDMINNKDVINYWNDRFIKNGVFSSGYTDKLIQKYDDNKRWNIFKREVELLKEEKILDIGCNYGPWSIRLAKKDMIVTGIDIIEEAIIMAKKKAKKASLDINFYKISIEESNFQDQEFDKIISITVLQHLLNDVSFSKAIKNISRQLKSNGKLILLESAPNKKIIEKLSHKRERTLEEQKKVCEQFGLKLLKIKGVFSFSVKWYYGVQKFHLPKKGEHLIQYLGVIIFNQLDKFFSKFSLLSSHANLKLMVFKKI